MMAKLKHLHLSKTRYDHLTVKYAKLYLFAHFRKFLENFVQNVIITKICSHLL